MQRGRCLCGGITFNVCGELPPIQVCHCGQCRQAQGGPFATNIPVSEAQVQWLSGRELFQAYESSPGKLRVFCRVCGSPLFSRKDSLPGVLRLRAGSLLGDLSTQIGAHIYCESGVSWWQDDAGVPHYAAGMPQH